MKPICEIEGCKLPRHARGLCKRHYNRACYYTEDFLSVEMRKFISPEQREDIRARRRKGEKVSSISTTLKIGKSTIFAIVKDIKPPKAATRGCLIPGCEKKHRASGYCASHYYRLHRYGSPTATTVKPLVTAERRENILNMRAAGIYITTIAKEIGVNKSTISRILNKAVMEA